MIAKGHEPDQTLASKDSGIGSHDNGLRAQPEDSTGSRATADMPGSINAEALAGLVAQVSHELRTPLHGILSFAYIGSQNIERVSKQKLRNYFDEIAGSGESLLAILNDLLDLSKLQSGKMQYQMTTGSLEQVTRTVIAELSLLASEHQVAMRVEPLGEPRPLVFDAGRMTQLMRNLLANALRHSPDGGLVGICLDYHDPDTVTIHVTDEGCGILPGEEEAIFGDFFQGTVRFGANNTGLGLPICRQIIEQGHHGRISARNRPGGGAEFIVVLPAHLPATLSSGPDGPN